MTRPWPPEVPSTPPAWPEQEWCDGGWSCQHPQCLDRLPYDLDDMAQEQSREAALDVTHRWWREAHP